jgi:hypothetical protein
MGKQKTYASMAREAEADGKVEEVSYGIFKFTEAGQERIGKIEQADKVHLTKQTVPVSGIYLILMKAVRVSFRVLSLNVRQKVY